MLPIEVLLQFGKVFLGASDQTTLAQSSLSLFLGRKVVCEGGCVFDPNRRSYFGGRWCIELPRGGSFEFARNLLEEARYVPLI